MQIQSVDISLSSTQDITTKPLPSERNELQHMPVQALAKTLSLAIDRVPAENRRQLTKLSVPGVFSALKASLSKHGQFACHASDKRGSVHFQNNQPNLSEDHCQIEFKQTKLATKESILDHLIFNANPEQFCGELSFHQILLSNPDQLMKLLTSDIQQKDRLLIKEATYSSPSLPHLFGRLQTCESQGEIERLMVPVLRESLLLQLQRYLLDKEELDRKVRTQSACWRQWNHFWESLGRQEKLQVMLLGCKGIEELVGYLREQKISICSEQLQKIINSALELKSTNVLSSFFAVPFRSLNHPITQYWGLLYDSIHRQIAKNKSPKVAKQIRQDRDYNSQQKLCKDITHRKKKGKRKSMSSESNQTNYTEHEQQIMQQTCSRQEQPLYQLKEGIDVKLQQRFERSQEDKRDQRENFSTKREARTIRTGQNKTRAGKIKKEKDEKMRETCDTLSKGQLGNPEISGKTGKENSLCSQIRFASASSNESASEIYSQESLSSSREDLKEATFNKLAEELSEMSDGISEQANHYYQRRIIAFSRIQFLLSHYSIPIKLFGSCANGIAVKNSDIDIAIDQSILYWMDFLPENEKVVVALERLEELFKVYPCFIEMKLIKTAAIPVIKLTVDTSIPFISQEYQQLNRPHNAGLIQADITIQTINQDNQSSHLGIRTTCAISKWLSDIKSLHSIVIVMKQFFAVSKLNLAYEGGLNTISMIVLFVAYILHAGLEAEENEALVLEKILKFYSSQFDEKTTGIDLMKIHGNSIYYKKSSYPLDHPQLMKAELQIRDPICQGKNMTRNCYQFPEIKKMFKSILENCFARRLTQLQGTLHSKPHREEKQSDTKKLAVRSQVSYSGNVFLELHSEMCKPL